MRPGRPYTGSWVCLPNSRSESEPTIRGVGFLRRRSSWGLRNRDSAILRQGCPGKLTEASGAGSLRDRMRPLALGSRMAASPQERRLPTRCLARLNIRRIDCDRDDAREALRDLRRQLSPRGDVVSPRGPRPDDRGVRRAADSPAGRRADLRRRAGPRPRRRARLHRPARQGARSLPSNFRVTPGGASGGLSTLRTPPTSRTLRRVRENILAFQSGILHRDAHFRRGAGCELGLRYRPLRRVGVCIPGGAAAYPSSLLMTAVPAQAAGVEQIAVVVPPTKFGGYNARPARRLPRPRPDRGLSDRRRPGCGRPGLRRGGDRAGR